MPNFRSWLPKSLLALALNSVYLWSRCCGVRRLPNVTVGRLPKIRQLVVVHRAES